MADTSLSEALKEAYASAPANEIVYHTLEIDHPDFTVPIRVVRDRVELIATTENAEEVTFIPFAFDVVPPDVQSEQMPTCTIEIDNVGRELMSQLEAAYTSSEPITMTYRQYLESDKSVPQNNPPLILTILSISANVMRIRATCGYADLLNKRFPNEEYTAERFPGLIAL
jgi:hypothetical protein